MKKISLKLFGLICLILVMMGLGISDSPIGNVRVSLSAQAQEQEQEETAAIDPFEKAVELIKKYEGLHQPRHWPLVGYGHKVLPGEKFSRSKAVSKEKAEEILRADLKKNCAVFREYGADSLLLGTLAYNIGSGNVKRSKVAAALKAGNRNIRDMYLAHSRYRGKTLSQLKRRRIEEFDLLFIDQNKKEEVQEEVTEPIPNIAKTNSPVNNHLLSSVKLSCVTFCQ